MKQLYNEIDESSATGDIIGELNEAFKSSFTLWARKASWRPVDPPTPSLSLPPERLAAVYSCSEPVVTPMTDAEQLVVIPVEAPRTVMAATTIVPAQPDGYWERLATLAHKSLQQRARLGQMKVVLEELSASMEESTWMRGLFQSFQACEASQAAPEVARLMLPKLCALIQARTVGYLPADAKLKPVWTDRRKVPRAAELLAKFPPRADRLPVVFNAATLDEEQQCGLKSLILTPVRFRGHEYGYLAAVDCGAHATGSARAPEQLSELEFGTNEGSLVEAAAAMLATHCRNASLLQSKERLVIGVIRTLGGAVDARDPYTKGHSDRVALYAREIAREMGIEEAECQRIYVTGLLHDIGKIGVPDAVLKKPGKLTYEEYEIIKDHARQGFEILQGLDDLAFTLPGVLHHHERIDGRGYPAELASDAIPSVARILAVADAYDAMTSSRAYRESMSFEKAEQIVRENIGTQFDCQASAAFLRILPRIHQIALADSRRRLPDSDALDDLYMSDGPPAMEIDTAVASMLEA